MHDLLVPDIALLEKWLSDSDYESTICDQCSGLHISALQSLDGILDSRLFVEPWGLLFTTELDIRNSAILTVSADLTRLNMTYPTLKIFINIPDDASPMLVVSSSLLSTQGMTVAQFNEFFGVTQETTQQLLQECQQMQYMFEGEDEEHLVPLESEDGINPSLH